MRDYLDKNVRKELIGEILGSENESRKSESLIRHEIYKGRLYNYLLKKMEIEIGAASAKKTRKISSINLTERVIKEESKLYMEAPERLVQAGQDKHKEHVNNIYEWSRANIAFKKANRVFKLHDQACIKIVPKKGVIDFRALSPHHYDVVPSETDPEEAEAYIISNFDKSRIISGDGKNQKIADQDDARLKAYRFYWWTKNYNFVTDGHGSYVDSLGKETSKLEDRDLKNQAGVLPFVDVAADKDFEFFIRTESMVTQFALDLAMSLSDTAEVIRYQGFATGVLASKEAPQNLDVGPRQILWLKIDPNDESGAQPNFQFVSPSPDIAASLDFNSGLMSMFLTSRGHSPKLINTKGEKESFTSGLDRFLATLEMYEASQDDIDLFTDAEGEAYEIVKAWNNAYYNVTKNGFRKEIAGVKLPQESYMKVNYIRPELEMSEKERLEVLEKRKSLGLITRVEMIMADRGMTEEEAQEYLNTIDAELDKEIEATVAGEDTELKKEIEVEGAAV